MTIALRANNDGSAVILVQGQPRITLDAAGNIVATTTAPYSDSSLKLATTEFVVNRGRSFKGCTPLQSSVMTGYILSASDVGMQFVVNADTASVAVSLPPAASVSAGAVIRINSRNIAGAFIVNIYPSGSETIFGAIGFTYTASAPLPLGSGEYAEFVCTGGQWQVIDSTIQMSYNGLVFKGSNSLNGFRKLPGGTILQWGQFQSEVATSVKNIDVPFPIPFPTGMINFVGAFATSDPSTRFVGFNPTFTNAVKVNVTYVTPTLNAIFWSAIGY